MMRSFATLVVCALLLPGAVRAQAAGTEERPVLGNGSEKVGVVRGRAVGIDLSDTLQIVIDTDSGQVKLSVLPTQIADLTQGDIVAFRYRDYGGTLWVQLEPPAPGAAVITPESFGQMGVVSGQITKINKSFGQIVVHGRSFRSHPENLQNLLPGQFVDVTYVQFGKAFGAVAIKPIGSQASPSVPGSPNSPAPATGGSGTR